MKFDSVRSVNDAEAKSSLAVHIEDRNVFVKRKLWFSLLLDRYVVENRAGKAMPGLLQYNNGLLTLFTASSCFGYNCNDCN